jgi:CBS domain-containing protein
MLHCREIMKRRILVLAPDASVNDAARKMKGEQIGFLPVCNEQGRPVGVVTERDIVLRVCAERLDGDKTTLERIMTRDPVRCSPDATLEHAEELMLRHHVQRILVVDSDDKLVGLITLADIAQYQSPLKLAQWLRELTAYHFRVER